MIEGVGAAPSWLVEIEARINSILALRSNWDTYNAAPVDVCHVASALDWLPRLTGPNTPMPAVVPTAARGVQFEWEVGGVAIELRTGDDGGHIFVADDLGETEGPISGGLLERAATALASGSTRASS